MQAHEKYASATVDASSSSCKVPHTKSIKINIASCVEMLTCAEDVVKIRNNNNNNTIIRMNLNVTIAIKYQLNRKKSKHAVSCECWGETTNTAKKKRKIKTKCVMCPPQCELCDRIVRRIVSANCCLWAVSSLPLLCVRSPSCGVCAVHI